MCTEDVSNVPDVADAGAAKGKNVEAVGIGEAMSRASTCDNGYVASCFHFVKYPRCFSVG